MTDSPQRREYRYRGRRAAVVVGLSAPLGTGAVLLLKWKLDEDVPVIVPLAIGAVCVGLVAVCILSALSAATVVDERHITLREMGRSRATAWPDVQAIEIEEVSTQTQDGVIVRDVAVLYDAAGRRRILPYVSSRACADLTLEVEWLRQMWLRHRGEDWQFSPAAAARLARRGRPAVWVVALLVGVCAGACGFAVSLLLAAVTLIAGQAPPGNLVMMVEVPLAFAVVAAIATVIVRRGRGRGRGGERERGRGRFRRP